MHANKELFSSNLDPIFRDLSSCTPETLKLPAVPCHYLTRIAHIGKEYRLLQH